MNRDSAAAPGAAPALDLGDYARIASWALPGLLALLAALTGSIVVAVLGLTLVFCLVAVRFLDSWLFLVAFLLVVIFVIPIKRYELPVQLPFDMEPYRIVVMLLTLVWVAALLIDPRVRLQRTAFDLPLLGFFLAILASAAANVGYIHRLDVETDVVKSISFMLSFVLVYYVVASTIRTRRDVEFVVKLLVVCGTGVAFFGVVEYHTGKNVFDDLSRVLPVLEFRGGPTVEALTRSDRLRVYASAQHPIALSVAMMMLLPLAVYLAQTTKRYLWWVCAFVIGLGALSTLSRTAVIMAVVIGLVMLVLRPRETKKLLPLLAPAFVVVFLALPNALGSFKSAFFPQGGLIAEQTHVVPGNELQANNRLADIGPSLQQWEQRPVFGQGYGSRIIELGPRQNAAVLDNQWLGLLLQAGLLGVGFMLWLFVGSARRLGALATRDPSGLGLLAGALTASLLSFGVAMITLDAFSFIQVTFLFFVVLAVAAVVIDLGRKPAENALDGQER